MESQSNSTRWFCLDALEQALYDRRPVSGLVHHYDRGSQYVSKVHRPTGGRGYRAFGRQRRRFLRQRLGGEINGVYKVEVIHRRGPWRSFEAVKFATLEGGRLV